MNKRGGDMVLRITGAVVLVVGFVVFAGATYGLHGMESVSRTAAQFAPIAQSGTVAPEGWKTHMGIYWGTWMFAAALACLGGLLLLTKRVTGLSFCMMAAGIVLLYPLIVGLFPGRVYPFENLNGATGLAALLFLCFIVTLRINVLRSRTR